jgi:hypothetical protein
VQTSNHILQQQFIGMSAFELRLPAMMMRVDKTRADDLVSCVDYFCSIGELDILSELRDFPVLDEDVGPGGYNVILRIVEEDDSVLEEGAASHDVWPRSMLRHLHSLYTQNLPCGDALQRRLFVGNTNDVWLLNPSVNAHLNENLCSGNSGPQSFKVQLNNLQSRRIPVFMSDRTAQRIPVLMSDRTAQKATKRGTDVLL